MFKGKLHGSIIHYSTFYFNYMYNRYIINII